MREGVEVEQAGIKMYAGVEVMHVDGGVVKDGGAVLGASLKVL